MPSAALQTKQGQDYENVEKVWIPIEPSRNNLMLLPETSDSQVRDTSAIPHSESALLPSTHTIILDFSMVHFVDARASIVLRQVRTEVALTRALVPTHHHHPNPSPNPD